MLSANGGREASGRRPFHYKGVVVLETSREKGWDLGSSERCHHSPQEKEVFNYLFLNVSERFDSQVSENGLKQNGFLVVRWDGE